MTSQLYRTKECNKRADGTSLHVLPHHDHYTPQKCHRSSAGTKSVNSCTITVGKIINEVYNIVNCAIYYVTLCHLLWVCVSNYSSVHTVCGFCVCVCLLCLYASISSRSILINPHVHI